jgi:hypothetical protein
MVGLGWVGLGWVGFGFVYHRILLFIPWGYLFATCLEWNHPGYELKAAGKMTYYTCLVFVTGGPVTL